MSVSLPANNNARFVVMTDLSHLYKQHVTALQQRYEHWAGQLGFDGIAVHVGMSQDRYLDDQPYPFWRNPAFNQWVPDKAHPGSVLLIRPGHKTQLIWIQPVDYWHAIAPLPDDDWVNELELIVVSDAREVEKILPAGLSRWAGLGECVQLLNNWGIGHVNPAALQSALNWSRSFRTDYEIACLQEANCIAARGHKVAEQTFRAGGSEFDILLSYLSEIQLTEVEQPYSCIAALNENTAVLHHTQYDREVNDGRSFLLDAGATFQHYISDITRTHSREENEYGNLIERINYEQLSLINDIRPGMSYVDLHESMLRRLASVLSDTGIVRLSADEVFAKGYSKTFMPHGLGHLIGLQTHDVGGWLQGPDGQELPRHKDYQALRLQRPIETGMTFTIEPGLYFIEMLLAGHRNDPVMDWGLIEQFKPYGGVRIEDTVLVTEQGAENLTRPAFAALQ